MPRNRSITILLFSAALAMFGLAALVVRMLSASGGIDTALDAYRYFRICTPPPGGTCLEFTSRQCTAIALVAVACGTWLVILGFRTARNTSAT